MSDEADKLGITISGVDAENTVRAGRAINKVEDAVGGLEQHIAAGLSPYIEDMANRIIAWGEEGNRAGKIVGGALEFVAYGAAFVTDAYKLGQAGVEAYGAYASLTLLRDRESV